MQGNHFFANFFRAQSAGIFTAMAGINSNNNAAVIHWHDFANRLGGTQFFIIDIDNQSIAVLFVGF